MKAEKVWWYDDGGQFGSDGDGAVLVGGDGCGGLCGGIVGSFVVVAAVVVSLIQKRTDNKTGASGFASM